MSRIDIRNKSQITDEIVFGGDDSNIGGVLLVKVGHTSDYRPLDIIDTENDVAIELTEDEIDHLILALYKAKDLLGEARARALSKSIR